jgi:hypothetical protein
LAMSDAKVYAADLASVVEHLPVLPVSMDRRQEGAPEGEGQ